VKAATANTINHTRRGPLGNGADHGAIRLLPLRIGTGAMETKLPAKVRRKVGDRHMLEAVLIDIALRGMIVCEAIKTAQWIAIAF
jgi:hypothetical protein